MLWLAKLTEAPDSPQSIWRKGVGLRPISDWKPTPTAARASQSSSAMLSNACAGRSRGTFGAGRVEGDSTAFHNPNGLDGMLAVHGAIAGQ
jgi:hypothetical protein